jgi:nitrate reductase gamma subunit
MLPGLDLTVDILAIWQKGFRKARLIIALAAAAGLIGALVLVFADAEIIPRRPFTLIGAAFAAVAFVTLTGVAALQRSMRQEQAEVRVQQVEQRFRENPTQPQAAWDLARVKLETYLDRNLNQVRSIFWLTVVVMGVGFALIFYGIANVFADPKALTPAIVAACSGVVVNIIGTTFLVIYRATMSQAREYVTILERINAVGMAVQVIESIDATAGDLRFKATAELARQLLNMYQVPAKLPAA